jgi:Protein of unknown function (DUF1573)
MKPVQIFATVVFAVLALSVTVWLGRYQGKISVIDPKPAAPPVDKSPLPIPDEGPYGKAVANETTFDFGTVEKGATGSHAFVITNAGPGPLTVKTGKTSCGQCTFIEEFTADVAPGKSVDIKIKWDIKAPNSKFRQTAEVYTTDPQNKKLEFAIQGRVDTPLHLMPEGVWSVGDLSDSEPISVEGVLYSTLEDLVEIERAESSSPNVTVAWEPISKQLLMKKVNGTAREEKQVKAGLTVKVTVAPRPTVGPMRESVKLFTKVRDGITVEFNVIGNQPGPIEVKGRGWNAVGNVLLLGEFPAEKGVKAKLSMYVRGFDGELTIEQENPDQTASKVRLAGPARSFGKSKVYDLDVEIPPGPIAVRRDQQADVIVLKLNHPQVSELKLRIDYYAK